MKAPKIDKSMITAAPPKLLEGQLIKNIRKLGGKKIFSKIKPKMTGDTSAFGPEAGVNQSTFTAIGSRFEDQKGEGVP